MAGFSLAAGGQALLEPVSGQRKRSAHWRLGFWFGIRRQRDGRRESLTGGQALLEPVSGPRVPERAV